MIEQNNGPMDDFDYNWRQTFGSATDLHYVHVTPMGNCVTYPVHNKIIRYDDVTYYCPNLEMLCNCGKPYKDHPQWKDEYERQCDMEGAFSKTVCEQTTNGVLFKNVPLKETPLDWWETTYGTKSWFKNLKQWFRLYVLKK